MEHLFTKKLETNFTNQALQRANPAYYNIKFEYDNLIFFVSKAIVNKEANLILWHNIQTSRKIHLPDQCKIKTFLQDKVDKEGLNFFLDQ